MKNPASQNSKRTSDRATTLPKADEETGGATGALAVQQPPPSLQDSSGQSDVPHPGTCGFKPVIYLKAGCPYCFKLRLALLEAGLMDRVAFQEFDADTQEERRIRTELSQHFFPELPHCRNRTRSVRERIRRAHPALSEGFRQICEPTYNFAGLSQGPLSCKLPAFPPSPIRSLLMKPPLDRLAEGQRRGAEGHQRNIWNKLRPGEFGMRRK